MNHIYVIGTVSGPYKVGYSSNVSARLKSLQTSSASPLTIFATADTLFPERHERAVHEILTEHRLSGEWFNCSLDTVFQAMIDVGLEFQSRLLASSPNWMEAHEFLSWLGEMAKPPFFAGDAECARLLGVSANSVVAMKKQGADLRTALACRALLHRMEPYS